MVISFNNLGNLGRLGNQMFQYASLRGIAAHRGVDFCVPPIERFGSWDAKVRRADANLYDSFVLRDLDYRVTDNQVAWESSFTFDEDLFSCCPEDADLLGHLQTEKYFVHIEESIRRDFAFKDEIYDSCRPLMADVRGPTGSGAIALHVRRGDYVENPNHPVLDIRYYESALELMQPDLPVLVVSDDVDWVKAQDLFRGARFRVSEGACAAVDLCLMSLCDYHVISNSTFGWWGAWLAESQRTIAPVTWFAGDLADHDTADLYPEDWILLESPATGIGARVTRNHSADIKYETVSVTNSDGDGAR